MLLSVTSFLFLGVILLAAKNRDSAKHRPSESSGEKETVEKEVDDTRRGVNLQAQNPCRMTTSKGDCRRASEADCQSNGNYFVSDARSALHAAVASRGGCEKSVVPVLRSITPRCASPMEGTWRFSLSADELYEHVLSYTLTYRQLLRCGYPRPVPRKPGSAVWLHDESVYSCRKTCSRCGSTFFITTEGEYYSTTHCRFHVTKHCRGVFSCCGSSAKNPGCQLSEYHICTVGIPRKSNTPAHGFVRTRPRPGATGGVYALDCEMCFTIRGLEVTKVSVVGWDGTPVYESYVRPSSPVLDYITAISGVTAEHLRNVQTRLQDVQAALLRLFSASTVLVGHGLENDLRVLKLLHDMVVDTAVIYPHNKGLPFRQSLRSLVGTYLKREVQAGHRGHDSTEDAKACMDLVLLKVANDLQQREGCTREEVVRPMPPTL
ncbi:putative exonuclease GOR [Haemaphysalis longicornis]